MDEPHDRSRTPSNTSFPSQVRIWAREAAAVLAAILIAFGLDSGWDSWQERRATHDALVALEQEFRTVRGQLVKTIEENETAIRRKEAFLALTAEDVLASQIDGDTLLFHLRDNWTFDPSRGALDAMLGSGQLGNVRSSPLRIAIASWPGLYADIAESQIHRWRDEIARRNAELSISTQVRLIRGGHPSELTYQQLLQRATTDQLLRNLIAAFLDELGGYLGELRPALVELDRTLRFLGSEISEF